MSRWLPALPLADLPPGTTKVRKLEGTPVALFHLDDGGLYAVDNRCPHEGFPLSQGTTCGTTLTCCWHNFKFDLRNGACLKGDEAVASYPVRIVGNTVEIELKQTDPAVEIPRKLESLHEALWQGRTGQVGRDAVRLLQLGMEEAALAVWTAAWDGRHCEWGSSHALPMAYDALLQAPRFEGPQFARHLIQALEFASETHVRRPAQVWPEAVDPGDDPHAAGVIFNGRVEAEDAPGAIALVRGALDKGWGRPELEPWLWTAVSAHHLSFGHRLIYQSKVFDLLDAGGWELALDVLGGHVIGVVNGTREEVLPSWMAFRRRLAAVDLEATWQEVGSTPGWSDGQALVEALEAGTPAAAFEAVQQALEIGAPLHALIDAMVQAASTRVLHFDVAIDQTSDNQDGWLSVTHCLTAAVALRAAADRHARPELLRLVHFVARMIHHHRVLDMSAPPALPQAMSGTVADASAAIDAQDQARALAIARHLLTEAPEALAHALIDRATLDAYINPIVSGHVLKTAQAAWDEHQHNGAEAPLLSVVRWLASPIRQRWTSRSTREALAFVLEGRTPKTLAP